MRWVKLTLPPVVRNSWLLTMTRLTSSSLAGATRTLVAVGTPRDASMLATIRPAAPRRGVAVSGPARRWPDRRLRSRWQVAVEVGARGRAGPARVVAARPGPTGAGVRVAVGHAAAVPEVPVAGAPAGR